MKFSELGFTRYSPWFRTFGQEFYSGRWLGVYQKLNKGPQNWIRYYPFDVFFTNDMRLLGGRIYICVWNCLCDVHVDVEVVCGLNTSNSCWVLPVTFNTSVTIITNFRTLLMTQTRHIILEKKENLVFPLFSSLKSVMTAACYFEKYFVFVSDYLSYWETRRVISKISFGSTFFYERPVIFWHRNDWMSKYLYKAQTDLFKFTLNLNCNNELFKMLTITHL